MILRFKLNGQNLQRIDMSNALTDTRNYLKYSINFSNEWADKPIIVQFNDGKKTVSIEYDKEGVNELPVDVLDLSSFWISCFTLDDVRITTNSVRVDLDASGYDCNIVSPSLPTEDLLLQLYRIAKTESFVSATYESNILSFLNKEGEVVEQVEIQGGLGVQSDWEETDIEDLAFIKHKPEHLVQDANYNHTDYNYSYSEKAKVDDSKSKSELNREYVSLEEFIIS